MALFWFLVLIGATWRVSNLACFEEGPRKVLDRFRELPLIREVTECFWCTSVWVGIIWAVVAFIAFDISLIMILPYGLALSTFAILLDNILTATLPETSSEDGEIDAL